MNDANTITVESVKPLLGISVRNQELLILIGTSLIALMLIKVTFVGYILFALFFSIVMILGKKRARFIKSGLRYVISKDSIQLYKSDVLYRTFPISNAEVAIERTPFGVNIVCKQGMQSYLGSDSVVGFANDLGQNSYEFLIYNIPNSDEVVQYIKDGKN